ncbi:MAG: hypothetical protein JWN04_1622 [Myxococcaceae bacterium]|nr:hypothetical protein [Myxococcaceae bacterium]
MGTWPLRSGGSSYTVSNYVAVFGRRRSSLNVIARLDEHADDRVVGSRRKVEQGHNYHKKIESKGDTISSWADGQWLARMTDSDPLWGAGHDHFAINHWCAELWFDNL